MTGQTPTVSEIRNKAKPVRALSERGLHREEIALSLAVDERLLDLQREGQVGFVLPTGEWAGVLAAAASAMRESEWIFPSLREARVALFRGLRLEELFRQALGLDSPEADPASSQAGHALPGTLADVAHRVAAPGSGLGTHLPHAVGAALAARLTRRSEAVLAIASIAATDGDDCHVALNFAAVNRAPVVFLFRGDSGWAKGSAVQRGSGYAVPASVVDGDDLGRLESQLASSLQAAREGKGPALIEVSVPKMPEVEPAGLQRATRLVDAAAAAARAGRRPAMASLFRGVFENPTWPLQDQERDLSGQPMVSPEEV